MKKRTHVPRRAATLAEMNAANVVSAYGAATSDPERNREIDLALAVMCALQRPGQRFSSRIIAQVTGLSHAGPEAIVQAALKKLRPRCRNLRRELAA